MRFYWYKIWINLLRRILPLDFLLFRRITRRFNLPISYKLNKDAILTLEDIIIDNEYAPYFPMHKKATVIDAGAHYGYFSLFAFRNLLPGSSIIALEPSSKNFKVLLDNLKSVKAYNVIPVNMALSNTDGEISFTESGLSINHQIGNGYDMDSLTVRSISLDSLLKEHEIGQVDFFKLDIEGGEFNFLLQTPAKVLRRVKVFSLEFHQTPEHSSVVDLIDRFEGIGFVIKRYDFSPNDGHLMASNGHIVAVRL